MADTGSTTDTFLTVNLPVFNKQRARTPITIRNPNGSIMTSTHEAELPRSLAPSCSSDGTPHSRVEIAFISSVHWHSV